MLEPVPSQVPQVDAIWKPPCIKCTRVPVPLQVLQGLRCVPAFRPLPVHVPQDVRGEIEIVLLVPLAASMKVMLA